MTNCHTGGTMKNTLNRYDIFLKVAETGNISRAAEALQYTQSGISHALGSLEEELGITLFVRASNGVSLTANGERILPYVQELVNRSEMLKQAAFRINHTTAGTLRVGSFSSVTALWVPDMINYFLKQYPDVRIEVLDGNYDEIRDWLIHGRIDCGFLSSISAEGLRFIPLYEDPLYVLTAVGHPLAKKDYVTLDEILDYPYIAEAPGSDNDINQLLEGAGRKPDIRYSFRDDTLIGAFVAGNIGITISQYLVLKATPSNTAMIPLRPETRRTIGIGMSRGQNSVLVNLLVDYMKDYCADYDPDR